MRPVLPYYGGKWRAAPLYGPPTRPVIVEPFAGGAGYSCRYGAGLEVVLIERYAPLAAAWRWLLAASPDEPPDLFRSFSGHIIGTVVIDRVVCREQRGEADYAVPLKWRPWVPAKGKLGLWECEVMP